jgi:hypothetical protein
MKKRGHGCGDCSLLSSPGLKRVVLNIPCETCGIEVETKPLKVGDTIFEYNPNHRIYERADGTKTGRAIELGHYHPRQITGETKQSWLVGSDKVNKKTLRAKDPGYSDIQYYPSAEACFEKVQSFGLAWRLADDLKRATHEQLLAIAEILQTKDREIEVPKGFWADYFKERKK